MSKFFKRHQKTIIWAVVIAFFVGGVGLVTLDQAGIFRRSTAIDGDGPTVAAVVNGDRIPVEQVDQTATNLLNQYRAYYQAVGQDFNSLLVGANGALFRLQVRAEAVDALIRQTLLVQEARRRKISVPKSEVDAEFREQYNTMLAGYQITEEQLATYLTGQGRTLQEFQASFRQGIEADLQNEALRRAVIGTVEPTDADLHAYLEKNIARYDEPEEVKASHILVGDLATAQDLLRQLEAGADFATLARAHSSDQGTKEAGGDLGWFGRGEMVPEFEDVAFSLQIGEISDPIETQYGVHIIQVTDRKARHAPTLVEIRDTVRTDYISETANERFASWYNEVRAASAVEIQLPLVEAYLIQQEDLDRGAAAFERVRERGDVGDPYLAYYLGRIYEGKAARLAGERNELEQIEEPTEEDTARIGSLRADQSECEERALALYMEVLELVDVDEKFLNRVLSLSPDSTTVKYLLGKLYVDQGNLLQAEQQFVEVFRKDPTFAAAYIASGDLAVKSGNHMLAKTRYESALGLRPEDTSVLLKLVNVELQVGELEEAERLLGDVARIDPGNVNLVIAEGRVALARLRSVAEERERLTALGERTSEEEDRLTALAGAIDGYYATAIDRFEKGLRSGGSLELSVYMGQTYFHAGRLDKAESEFRSVITRSPYHAEAYEGLGRVQLARGEKESAARNLELALTHSFNDTKREEIARILADLRPSDPSIRYRLARIFADQYKWSAAIREYAAVLDLAPGDLQAYLGIAEAYQWRTEYGTAVDYLNRGLARAATDADRLSLYKAMNEAYRQQVGVGRPLSSAGLDALIETARLQIALGQEQDALKNLEQVQKDDPAHRRDEVRSLIVQAGGTVPAEPIVDETEGVQTESNTRVPIVETDGG